VWKCRRVRLPVDFLSHCARNCRAYCLRMFIVVGSGLPTAAGISAPLIMIEAIAPSIESLPKKARQVLAAAKTVFLRDGYDLASMDAIAREARVSKGTLYGHFTGKEQLFTAVVLVECRRHAELLDRIANRGQVDRRDAARNRTKPRDLSATGKCPSGIPRRNLRNPALS